LGQIWLLCLPPHLHLHLSSGGRGPLETASTGPVLRFRTYEPSPDKQSFFPRIETLLETEPGAGTAAVLRLLLAQVHLRLFERLGPQPSSLPELWTIPILSFLDGYSISTPFAQSLPEASCSIAWINHFTLPPLVTFLGFGSNIHSVGLPSTEHQTSHTIGQGSDRHLAEVGTLRAVPQRAQSAHDEPTRQS
jgi:hypothetical protein